MVERSMVHGVAVPEKKGQRFAGRGSPDPGCSVGTDREDTHAIRTELGVSHSALMGERQEKLAVRGVPYSGAIIVCTRDNPAAIRTELRAVHGTVV
jgi:hypothetical protein